MIEKEIQKLFFGEMEYKITFLQILGEEISLSFYTIVEVCIILSIVSITSKQLIFFLDYLNLSLED